MKTEIDSSSSETTNVLPYRVIVYGEDDTILYDRIHDEFELWKLAPGLSLRVRGLDVDAGSPEGGS